MIQFPGADYQFFFRWTKEYGINAFRELGVRRFWLKNDKDASLWNQRRHVLSGQWDEILDLRTLPAAQRNPKSCPDAVPLLKKNGVVEAVAVWSVGNHSLESLIDKTRLYSTVIINMDVNNKTWVNKYNIRFAERVRWIHDIRQSNPKTRFIFAGTLEFDVAYCLGLDGICSNFVTDSPIYRVFRPDGSNYVSQKSSLNLEDALGDWKWMLAKYPAMPRDWFFFKMLTMIPEYQKEFFKLENREYGKYTRHDFTEADYYWGYEFRSSRIKDHLKKDYVPLNPSGSVRFGSDKDSKHRAWSFAKKMSWDDGILCNDCILNYCCYLYEEGGACVVPGTHGSNFASKFSSRKASDILDGMGKLLERKAISAERRLTELDENQAPMTKEDIALTNSLFKDAAVLAKLRDPTLARPAIAVQVNNQNQIDGPKQADARQITDREYAEAIREIEATGVDRNKITQDMVNRFIETKEIVYADQPQIGQGAENVTDAEIADYEENKDTIEESRGTGMPRDEILDGDVVAEEKPVYPDVESVF